MTNLLERAANALPTAAATVAPTESRKTPKTSTTTFVTHSSGNTPGNAERDEAVEVEADFALLAGQLTIPRGAIGIVVFVHGSGSSRHSPRNRYVADRLNAAGLGTLLFDLLTETEELDRANVFDIERLASRLTAVTLWLREQPGVGQAPIGYFGASTGAAAALCAAAEPAAGIAAIVSRGGRPDLAEARLAAVRSPTLLIVGERDEVVLGLNREAQQWLRSESKLAIVPGASHLFEEPGALDTVTRLTTDWFGRYFTGRRPNATDEDRVSDEGRPAN